MSNQALLERARALLPDRSSEAAARVTANMVRETLKPADPQEPPPEAPQTTNPRRHDVVAWRHVGPLDTTRHPSKESALAYADSLFWGVFYKYAIMDGREQVARGDISAPAEFTAEQVAAIIGE